MKHLWFILLLFSIASVDALAQSRTLTGTVTDGADEPIIGANVVVSGTTIGTVTDIDGKYSLVVPEDAKQLIISFIGFQSITFPIEASNVIDATLKAGVDLTEVLVVGYGTQQKRDITGSVANLSIEDLETVPVTSIEQGLQGRIAGVDILQNSGTPGSAINVRIRGGTSILGDNQPLYIVDGVPITTGNPSGLDDILSGQEIDATADINASEIESITVLKDAASAALYGSRAANGVVIINTKRGQQGKTKFSFNAYRGFQQDMNRLEFLSGPEHLRISDIALEPYGGVVADFLGRSAVESYGGVFDEESGTWDYSNVVTTDWQEEVLRTAAISNYEVSAKGGSENTRFYTGFSMFDQEGIVIGSSYKRFNGRFNLDHQASKDLSLSLSLGLSRSENERIVSDNTVYSPFANSIALPTFVPAYDENGDFGPTLGAYDNPLAIAEYDQQLSVQHRILGNIAATYQIAPSLSFTTRWSADVLFLKEDFFWNPLVGQAVGTQGEANTATALLTKYVNENTLNFNTTIGDNQKFDALLGFSWEDNHTERSSLQATGFPNVEFTTINAATNYTDGFSSYTDFGIVSYFSRFNYSINDKYRASFSLRLDGSSRFGENNRYALFPAGSLGWTVSDEPFLANSNTISNVNLRLSYGLTGNQSIGNFASRGLYAAGRNYAGSAGTAPQQLGNPDLTWEETAQFNAGLDLAFFKGRVALTADYYVKTTTELLLPRPISGTTGFTQIQQNVGEIENKGIEFLLTTYNITNGGDGFNWNTSFNMGYNKPVVKALNNDEPLFYGLGGDSNAFIVGEVPAALYGYESTGIFQSEEEVANSPQAGSAVPGDLIFTDVDGDGAITGNDKKVIGSPWPNVFGGITNTFSFKGFELSAFFSYSFGNDLYWLQSIYATDFGPFDAQLAKVANYWTPENPNTDIPRPFAFGSQTRQGSHMVFDASYIRLKNMTLAYNFSSNLTQKLGLEKIRLYAQGQNLMTSTDYPGLDPEANSGGADGTNRGYDFYAYPQARTITFGVNLGF